MEAAAHEALLPNAAGPVELAEVLEREARRRQLARWQQSFSGQRAEPAWRVASQGRWQRRPSRAASRPPQGVTSNRRPDPARRPGHQDPYPASYAGAGEGPVLPVSSGLSARRPSLLGSSCSRRGVQLSSRSAHQAHGLDPDGVSTFHTRKMRLGRAPSLPRDQRYPPPGPRSPGVASRLSTPGPAAAAYMPSHSLNLTGHRQGFTHVRPSSLPLTCGSSMAEAPLGLNAQLHTPPLPATHVSAGTSLDTGPKFSRSIPPSPGCPYFAGATSCRTLRRLVPRPQSVGGRNARVLAGMGPSPHRRRRCGPGAAGV
jgi:hypothetical protein